MFRVTFRGVRGSVAVPGPSTLGVGGNTSCVEVRCGDNLVVLDGGTGLRSLGASLGADVPVYAHLFFSHVHWDHVQGFPFFEPAFNSESELHLYGPATLRETLARQMAPPNFPLALEDLPCQLLFHELSDFSETTLDSDVTVRAVSGDHPGGVLMFGVQSGSESVVYATDVEHGGAGDERLTELARGAQLLIYDSMYLPEEYSGEKGQSRRGWGHSTYAAACALAKRSGVKRLALFHHDPQREDHQVEEIESRSKSLFTESFAAREGQEVNLD